MTKSVEIFLQNFGILVIVSIFMGVANGITKDLSGLDSDYFFGFGAASIYYSLKRK